MILLMRANFDILCFCAVNVVAIINAIIAACFICVPKAFYDDFLKIIHRKTVLKPIGWAV